MTKIEYKHMWMRVSRRLDETESSLKIANAEIEELRKFKEFVSEHDEFYFTKFKEKQDGDRNDDGCVIDRECVGCI